MADDIEVEITIPDESESEKEEATDAGIVAGIASEKADNAEEQAESAEITADTALVVAENSYNETADIRQQLASQQEFNSELQTQILSMQETLAFLLDTNKKIVATLVADLENEDSVEEMPPDETPPNRHWLMKPLFGGK